MSLYFIETPVFTRRVTALGLEADLRGLREALVANPAAGLLDPGTGGLRKIRMPSSERQKGKRSGARAHYLYLREQGVIYLIFLYGKDEQSTLSPGQKRQLAVLARQIKAEWSTRPGSERGR